MDTESWSRSSVDGSNDASSSNRSRSNSPVTGFSANSLRKKAFRRGKNAPGKHTLSKEKEEIAKKRQSHASGSIHFNSAVSKIRGLQAFQRQIQKDIREYLRIRQGLVLNRGLILKIDKFPLKEGSSIHTQIPVTISGARNLRQASFGRIFGAGQPTISGIYGILNILRAGREIDYAGFSEREPSLPVLEHSHQRSRRLERMGSNVSNMSRVSETQGSKSFKYKSLLKVQTEVLWINLREEPILYINGRAVVLRDFEEPFQNLMYFRGINKDRIEDVEWRLKEDAVRETKLNGGNLMLHVEDRSNQLTTFWEAVKIDDIKTSREVFFQFQMEGYRVKYKRLPATPEKAPPKKFFDLLLKYVMQTSLEGDTAIVFNCQTGKTRSTFAMVAACLMQFWRGVSTHRVGDATHLNVIVNPFLRMNSIYSDQLSAASAYDFNLPQQGKSNLRAESGGASPNKSDDLEKFSPTQTTKLRRNSSKARSNSLLKAALQSQAPKENTLSFIQENSDLPPEEEALDLSSRQKKHAPKSSVSAFNQIDEFAKHKAESFQTTPIGKQVTRVLSGRTMDSLEKELDILKSPMHKPIHAYHQPDQLQIVNESDRMFYMNDRMLRGWYQPVINMLRLLETGLESKSHVDYFIDQCDKLLNIRETIYRYRAKATETQSVKENQYYLKRAAATLVRYLLLIIFDSYVNEQIQRVFPEKGMPDALESFNLPKHAEYEVFSISFEQWLDARPELRKILGHVQREPEVALASPIFLTEEKSDQGKQELYDLIKYRHGSMLNQDSILKFDNLPSFAVGKSKIEVTIKGAVNFRVVPGTTICGSCSPTISGIVSVVHYLKAFSKQEHARLSDVKQDEDDLIDPADVNDRNLVRVCWINLREEPIVFVNKKPSMLRSVGKPFQNVQAFESIDEERLEKAEERLKRDVLTEAELCGGKILVHVEEKKFQLVPMLEEINLNPTFSLDDDDRRQEYNEDVFTPKEAFESVMGFADGAGVELIYERVALSPEKAPNASDIDKLLAVVKLYSSPENCEGLDDCFFIFSCQMGKGRSTVASILAYLQTYCVPHVVSNDQIASEWEANERHNLGSIRNAAMLRNNPFEESYDSNISRDFDEEDVTKFDSTISSEMPGLGNGFQVDNELPRNVFRNKKEPQFNIILALMRVLKNGSLAKKWADLAIEKCGLVENIKSKIKSLMEKAAMCRMQERASMLTERALMYLQRYFMIILVASFVLSQKESEIAQSKAAPAKLERRNSVMASVSSSPGAERKRRLTLTEMQADGSDDQHHDSSRSDEEDLRSFSAWFSSRKELSTLLEELKHKSALGIQQSRVLSAAPALNKVDNSASMLLGPVEEEDGETDFEGEEEEIDEVLELVASRGGSVLVNGSILKEDHFPGCERLKDSEHRIVGAPNFRPVQANYPDCIKGSQMDQVNNLLKTYGTGIPTLGGIKKALKVVQERDNISKAPKYEVVWINLREEPILYVSGKPYVVRKLEHPFENLEYTGINTERVESMENRLKQDVLNEIRSNNGMLLLHGEDEFGLTPHFLNVDLDDPMAVLTPKELYEHLGSTQKLKYFRIPITDEQAPKLLDYDKIMRIVLGTSVKTSSFIVNCQMGRGRTTTGTVVIVALRLWQLGVLNTSETIFNSYHQFRNKNRKTPPSFTKYDIKYRQGKLRGVIELVRVLDNGVGAKLTLDIIADMCDSVQNIRESIFELKQAAEKAQTQGAIKQASINNRGVQYVKRYAQLIVFVAYLMGVGRSDLEMAIVGAGKFERTSFTRFMFSRREVLKLIKRLTFP